MASRYDDESESLLGDSEAQSQSQDLVDSLPPPPPPPARKKPKVEPGTTIDLVESGTEAISAAARELQVNRLKADLQSKKDCIKALRVDVRLAEEKTSVTESRRTADNAYHSRIINHMEKYVEVLRKHHADMCKEKARLENELRISKNQTKVAQDDVECYKYQYDQLRADMKGKKK